jgi:adenylate cyclase class 2
MLFSCRFICSKKLKNCAIEIVLLQEKCPSMHINFEFKAKCNNLSELEERIQALNPHFIGEDHQTDTYFKVPAGRLKLREGNIENALIFYQRTNTAAAKQSDVTLYPHTPDGNLKQILKQSLGIKTVVEKKRRIYFIDNVKFHFDTVTGLGSFVEVEAIDSDGTIGIEKLKAQCQHYEELFDIQPADFIAASYSDLLAGEQ